MADNLHTIRLGEVCHKIGSGATPRGGKKSYLGGNISLIRSLNVHDYGFQIKGLAKINDQQAASLNNVTVQEDDVLFNITGASIARCCVVPEDILPARVNQHVSIIRTDKSILNPFYLHYYLILPEVKSKLISASGGSSREAITKAQLEDFILDVPDVLIQNSVGKVLSSLDSKIELNSLINAELETLKKTIFEYWFVQFDFPDAKGEPYKSSGGKMVWNEALNLKVPEGWTQSSLMGYIEFERGISYTTKDIESTIGLPMINLASIDINRNYRPNELKYFSGKYPNQKIVKNGDLLIACTDLTRNADIIGSPIIVPKEYEKYLYSMDLAKVHILSDDIVDMYLYMMLRTDFFHNYIKYFASGTNVLHLNLDGILWYPTVIPPKTLQIKFANIIREFSQKQAEILNENNALSSLRNWLLPMLMNGQVFFN